MSLAVALAALPACIDTSPVGLTLPPLCLATSAAPEPSESVVLVEGDLRLAGRTVCSGYAVTPSVIVTNSVCVIMPAGLVASDLDRPLEMPSFEGEYYAYSGNVDYASVCDVDAGWEPREQGQFGAWPGEPLSPSQLTVSILEQGEPVAVSNVRQVLLSHAGSRCADSIAALVLAEPLPVPYRPLRLSEETQAGEAVIMSSLDPMAVTTLERSANIEVVTGVVHQPGVPARALVLSQQSCYYEPGGGLLSEASGALIGVLGYGTGSYCGDPQGKTMATVIAPYQRMLMEAADAAPDVLHLEPAPLLATPAPLPRCAPE